jgi:type I restriction enzyme, S subunit
VSDQPSKQPSGLAWAPDVPAHWTVKKLAFLASLQSGDSITADDIKDDGPYPVYGGNGLRGYTDRFTHDGEYALIGRQGALCGNINYAKGEFWASEHAVVVAPREEIAVHWLGELLRAMELNQYSVSAAQPGLSVETIAALRVPIPPLKEQRAIADYLDRETARLDALVEAKERMLGLLAEKRRALITRAVTRGLDSGAGLRDSGIPWLGEIPKHWRLAGFTKYLRSLVDYRGKTPEKSADGVFLVTARNIRSGYIDYAVSEEYVEAAEYEDAMRRGKPKLGELLITTEAPLGQAAIVDREDIALAQRVIKLDYEPQVLLNAFVLQWILAAPFQYQLSSLATGSTALGIKGERLHMLRTAIPPVSEQHEILAHIAAETSTLEKVRLATARTVKLLKERRAALIAAAVTGQIDVGSGVYDTDAASQNEPERRQ